MTTKELRKRLEKIANELSKAGGSTATWAARELTEILNSKLEGDPK